MGKALNMFIFLVGHQYQLSGGIQMKVQEALTVLSDLQKTAEGWEQAVKILSPPPTESDELLWESAVPKKAERIIIHYSNDFRFIVSNDTGPAAELQQKILELALEYAKEKAQESRQKLAQVNKVLDSIEIDLEDM